MGNPQRSLEARLNWLGGIIDGEGMITAIKHSGKTRKANNYLPRISIVNTDPALIREVLEILTEAHIPHYVQHKAGKGTWKDKIEVIIQGKMRCAAVLPQLIPYLVSKRSRAEALLNFCESRLRAPHKSPYTEHEWNLIDEVKSQLRSPLIRPETTRQTPAEPVMI